MKSKNQVEKNTPEGELAEPEQISSVMCSCLLDVSLVCFSCGTEEEISITRPIQFSFELVDLAEKINWIGVFDLYNHRSAIFCSKECMKKQTTKKGTIRLRPKQ